MDNGLFNCIMRDDQYAEDAVVRVLRNCRQNNQERCLEIAMEVAAKTLKLRTEEVRMIAMKLLQQFVALTEDQIASIAEPLDEVFTPLLAIYYGPGVKFCVSVFRQSQEWRWKAGRILA